MTQFTTLSGLTFLQDRNVSEEEVPSLSFFDLFWGKFSGGKNTSSLILQLSLERSSQLEHEYNSSNQLENEDYSSSQSENRIEEAGISELTE